MIGNPFGSKRNQDHVWTTETGNIIRLGDMGDYHLRNAHAYLSRHIRDEAMSGRRRRKLKLWRFRLKIEMIRRIACD